MGLPERTPEHGSPDSSYAATPVGNGPLEYGNYIPGSVDGRESVYRGSAATHTTQGLSTQQQQKQPPQQHVPIAIVGMACRLPGECSTPSRLWDFLSEGKSSWKPRAPRDRFNYDAFSHEDPDFDGTFCVAGGHFNDYVDLSRFDSSFFGLPQSEARVLDPQQRLLLETSYECLENGGIPMESLAGRKVGCFVAFSMGGKPSLPVICFKFSPSSLLYPPRLGTQVSNLSFA